MYKLGMVQNLEIKRFTKVGIYLDSDLLLPKKEIEDKDKVGDFIDVFIYKDHQNRFIATKKIPYIKLGGLAVLKVVDINNIGAFLDWGLEKDLFLPFHEQTTKLEIGRMCLVNLYIDKSERLCATMNIRDYLEKTNPYKKDEVVKGIIYAMHDEYGAFVAIDNKYDGRISKDQLIGIYRVGDILEAKISKKQKDGKVELKLFDINEKSEVKIKVESNPQKIMKALIENNNYLELNDKSDPKLIKNKFNISKTEFKRAIGRLLKQNKITITDTGIKKK